MGKVIFVKKNLPASLAARRREGVLNLLRRGWTKQIIAAEVGISTDNLRTLMKEGRGKVSQQGLMLDLYLEQRDALDPTAVYRHQDRPKFVVREPSPTYSISRMMNIPSPEQIENARLLAKMSGDKNAISTVEEIANRVLDVRQLCDEIETDFKSILQALKSTA